MKGSVEVQYPRPTRFEWEATAAPKAQNDGSSGSSQGSVNSIPNKSSTSIEAIKDQILNEQLRQAREREQSEPIVTKTESPEQPFKLNDITEEDVKLEKEKPKTDEENKYEEIQEQKFLEAQRNSSLGSRAKSRSNKHTPETEKDQPKEIKLSKDAKCFRKLNLDQEPEKVRYFL